MRSRVLLMVTLVVLSAVTPGTARAGARSSQLNADLAKVAAGRADTVSVTVHDERTHRTYAYRPSAAYDTASIVKVDILQTLLWQRQKRGLWLTQQQQSLAHNMIVHSDNDAASELWREVGYSSGVAAYNRAIHLSSTTFDRGGAWGLTRTTTADQVTLVRAVTFGPGPLASRARLFVRGLMGHVERDQAWGVSAGVPQGPYVELKNGWLPRSSGGWRVNSIGHVRVQGRDYDIAVLSMNNSSMQYGIGTVEAMSRAVYRDLG
jgi:hypothetical protein